jgi:hypothetical protein
MDTDVRRLLADHRQDMGLHRARALLAKISQARHAPRYRSAPFLICVNLRLSRQSEATADQSAVKFLLFVFVSIRGFCSCPFAVRTILAATAILFLLLAPARNYAISVDRSEEQLRAMPLASATPNAARVPTAEVQQQVERVLTAPEYAWRNPSKVEAPPSWLEQFSDWLRDSLASFSRALDRLGRAISRWLASLFPQASGIRTGGSDGMSLVAQILSWVTIIAAAAILTLILVKIISRRRVLTPPKAPPAAPTPDLESEDTTADQLPEDEWLRLARQKAEDGDLRQALRALFLAVLSLLGDQGLILIRRSKSNFDYERELKRKLNSLAGLDEIFSADRKLFERCWYGAYPVTVTEFEQSDSLYQRLRNVCLRKSDRD